MADFTAVNAFLSKQPDLRRGQGARTGELRALQVKWGTVPPDYMSYLKTYGWATFGSTELLGLGVDVPDHLALLDRAETLWAGASIKIPTQLLPIHESSGDWYYCLSGGIRGNRRGAAL